MDIRFVPVFLIAGACLTACGGGGGGNSNVMPVPFTTFSAVKPNQPVNASGISQTVSAMTTPPMGNVTSTTVNPVDTANSTAQMTYGTPTTVSAFSFSAPASSVSFSGFNVQCPGAGVCGGSIGNSVGVVMNPLNPPAPALAWNYQSFGYWLVMSSSTSSVGGAMSFGSRTPVAGIPVGGTATYNGLSSGTYVDQNGNVWVHVAKMTSMADFGAARSVAFSTNTTNIVPITGGMSTPAPTLDLTGNLAITPASSQFTGVVKAPGSGMSGSATGSFYGPNVQEIGGIFSLKGTGPQTMLGAFGGKPP